MPTLPLNETFAKLSVSELNASLHAFMQPVTALLPDVRLGAVAELLTRGIVSSQSPIVTQIARGASYHDQSVWPTCQRAYRFLDNQHFSFRTLRTGLYRIGQQSVRQQRVPYLLIGVDPVNFEKPYSHLIEAVSIVHQSTPPSLTGQARQTHGYPAITATVLNTRRPAISYANGFSYTLPEFVSQNREIERALRMSKALFSRHPLRFVAEAGLDDQKIFAPVARLEAEFIIRAYHERNVAVYHERLERWEPEKLLTLTSSVAFRFEQSVSFTHARQTRHVTLHCGWYQIRLLDSGPVVWVLVAHDAERAHDLVLLTHVPLTTRATVQQVYHDWRLRSQIEHGYRFDQEAGLDVEAMRVQTLERMRRLFILVLLAAQFVAYINVTWKRKPLRWLRLLGGKLESKSDRNGLYVLLRGISAVWQTAATLTFLLNHPFPAPS